MIQAGTSSQSQAMPLVKLSQNDRLRLSIAVPESAVSDIHVGASVEVHVDALPPARCREPSRDPPARVNPDTRTMETEVDVANPDLTLVPGMYAQASIALAHARGVIVVPAQAIDRAEGGENCLVVTRGLVERHAVTLGMEGPDRAEILTACRSTTSSSSGIAVNSARAPTSTPRSMPRRCAKEALMSRFSIRNPYLIVVICLIVIVVGLTSVIRMPVDLFPAISIPEVVVATFYSGMPPEQIETDITGRFERFFTLGAGIDHMESRSLPGVSIIKVFFQPGTDADSDVNEISNLAMADLRRLPPGTLPPIVQKFDASSLPVCLITLKGRG